MRRWVESKNRFWRGNIDMTSPGAHSITRMKCKILFAIVLFFYLLYLSVRWINWNAAIVFYKPSLDDGGVPAVDVSEERLITKRWVEKRHFMEEVFKETCENNADFHILTNFNFRVLGTLVEDSVAYFCNGEKLYVNLRITPVVTNTRLECTESYAGQTTIRTDRYHPVEYSHFENGRVENHTSISYEETCMFYQTVDLLKGKWKL